MKTGLKALVVLALGILFFLGGCESTTEPTTIGGDTNLELTQVGNMFGVYLSTDSYIPGFDRMTDSVVITKNDNSNVTVHAQVGFDSIFVVTLDSALGTTSLPYDTKLALVDTYLQRFGATLDTTDKQAMTLSFDLKLRITSEGIQDYVNSKGDLSRPFTVVKYNAAVGDTYEFTNSEGVKITRTVTYRSTTDDYSVGFWLLKIIKVEQTQEDPIIERITYYANHKYGLVGVVLRTTAGKEVKLGIFPPTL